MNSPAGGYALTGCGCFSLLIAVGVAAFGAFHVFLDPRGKISADEAMPALIGGVCCSPMSLILVGAGIFLAIHVKKKAEAEAAAAAEGDGAPSE